MQSKTSGGGGGGGGDVVVYILRQSGTVLCYCLSNSTGLTLNTSHVYIETSFIQNKPMVVGYCL